MIDRKLDLTNSIKECLPVVLEYFVKFYGEEHREIITERLRNCTYICYTSKSVIKSYLRSIYNDKTNELVEEFFLDIGLENTDFNKEKYLCCYVDFFNISNINLYKIFKCMESDDYINKNNLVYYLSKFSGNDDLEFGTKEFYKIVDELKMIKPNFDKMLQKFDLFKEEYSKYQRYVDSCEILEKKLSNKYGLLYLKEIFEYLDDHDKKLVEDAIANDKSIKSWHLNCNGILYSGSLNLRPLIDSFSSESERILNDENVKSYVKNNIYRDRIKYFNKLGINIGDNYEDYVKDERCLKKIPGRYLVDEFIEIRNELNDKEKEEYITSINEYQKDLKEIEKLDLIDKNIPFDYKFILNKVTAVSPNIRKKDGEIRLYNLLLFSGDCLTDYFDVTLVHELNHLIETDLLKADNEGYVVRSGWDILNCKIEDDAECDEKRDFEYLNEVINELLCQEVIKNIHDDGIYLLDDKETSRIKGGTSYERGVFLVRDFLEEFKEIIKYSRISGDMDSLYKMVGKDNLIELNNLVRDFFDCFSGVKYYELCDELEEKIDSDNVRFYNNCIERRDVILSKMRERKMNSEVSNCLVR